MSLLPFPAGLMLTNPNIDYGTPDANTLFLCRFNTATPKNEVGNVNGTLVGNAFCDTAGSQLVCDGTGDWATWAGGSTFDVTTNWTTEFHTNHNDTSLTGTSARSATGNTRYCFNFPGDGRVQFFIEIFDNVIALLAVAPASALDGNEHHIAVCRDGGTWYSYFDGVSTDQEITALAPTNSANDFFIGTDALASSSRDIQGRFGRVKLSNIARYPGGIAFTPKGRLYA